jgi:pimeloyl-ACP methyl ester carboxylesterase
MSSRTSSLARFTPRPKPSLATKLGYAVAAIAGIAVANHLVARRTERRNPPQGRFVEVDGIRLHYLEKGSGRPIVLLHGNGTMAEDFVLSGVFDTLARSHRVIAFDRPGFGHSERPRDTIWTAHAQAALLSKATRRLGIARPVLVGHSWGTLVALTMALEHQEDTAAVVLLSGYYTPTVRLDVPVLSGPAIPLLGDLIRYTISPLLGWLITPLVFRKLFGPAEVPAHFKAGFPKAMMLRPWQIRAAAADTALMIPGAAALRDRHGELRIPLQIVAGTGDRIADVGRQSARLHDEVAHSTLRALEGVGHMVHHTAPAAVVAAIEEAVRASEKGPVQARIDHDGVAAMAG